MPEWLVRIWKTVSGDGSCCAGAEVIRGLEEMPGVCEALGAEPIPGDHHVRESVQNKFGTKYAVVTSERIPPERLAQHDRQRCALLGVGRAAFASENGLAKIVGTTPPGRLVASKPLRLSDGYFLILPIGAYVTWLGRRMEVEGVKPAIHVEPSHEALLGGRTTS